MGEFSRDEFSQGMREMGVSSVEEIHAALPRLRADLSDAVFFRKLYCWAFGFSVPKGQKFLQIDHAIELCRVLMAGQGYKHLDAWCDFLREHYKRPMNKDNWQMFYDFTRTVKDDFSNFDPEDSSWPNLIDDFVSHMTGNAPAKTSLI